MAYSEIFWPLSLPQKALVDSYSETPAYDVITTEMETGPQRQRKRSSAAIETRAVKYWITDAQRTTLKAFLSDNAGRSFWWPDAADGDVYRYVRLKGGQEVQFVPTSTTRYWYVTFTLEIWPYASRN